MTIERLREIIEYGNTHSDQVLQEMDSFSQQVDFNKFHGVRDLLQIVRPVLQEMKYRVIELPLQDTEIGAFIYRGDAISYLVLNTSIPVVNANFALCHELYHVFFPAQENENKAQVEFDYFENREENQANLFAGNVLMPTDEFKAMFKKFYTQYSENILNTIVSLMNYFRAPFMAVLIRSCQLGIYPENSINEEFFSYDVNKIQNIFDELWFDSSILKPSNNDDSERLKNLVKKEGECYIEKGYINQRTLKIVLENIDTLISTIKRNS